MEKAEQVLEDLLHLTKEQLDEVIDLYYKAKQKESDEMCAR